ncbi:MAG: hypothetical protein V1676_00010 [Candidatus Diapherotrites archaeon]
MPTVERKPRHPYDLPHYRQMWGPELYKAKRAFYAINILKQRDHEFGLKFGEIQRQHSIGKISGTEANDLISAEIGTALRRMAMAQQTAGRA